MRNLLFKIAYDGAAFHGWQQQNNAVTVQEELRKAWFRLTGEDANIIGCSRTDAGVHANEFFFNVRTNSNIPVEKFPVALASSKLPGEIAVYSCSEVPYEFNARFDCVKKEYVYVIENSVVASPFMFKHSFNYKYDLDVELMNRAAKFFIGTFDFSAFCAADAQVKSKVRTVYDAGVVREGELVKFYVCGDGFLYNMVRIMVGTLLYVNNGKIKADDIPAIIESKDRTMAGITAIPDGLYLNKVYYGGENTE
ncbi:MAG: tRNA pseudouridine(38-40) synthase TruA [Ruminococcaceae bacterium]|nr:tRNA pseudouridine(38-40) synthase TruA [Oscillospiraceae bacterium]